MPKLEDLVPGRLMRELLSIGPLVRYEDGEVLHLRGDAKPGLSIIQAGTVVAGNVGLDGSVLTTSGLGPGDCFGEFTLFAGLPRTHDITSVGESAVYQLPRARFMALFNREPQIGHALLTINLMKNHELLEFLDNLRRLPLSVRVAKLLLANTRGATGEIEINCRQDELALTFGVTRVSIGKVIAELQAEGLVRSGYRKLRVPDVGQLRRWVEENSLISPLRRAN